MESCPSLWITILDGEWGNFEWRSGVMLNAGIGLCKCMSVRHLCQESISHTENSKHSCSCRHMLQISVQLCPSVETLLLASSFSSHSLQNCPTYFQVTPHHIAPSYLSSFIRPYVPSRALRSSSAHRLCVSHVSSVFGSRGFRSTGPAIWTTLLGYFLLHHSYFQETA